MNKNIKNYSQIEWSQDLIKKFWEMNFRDPLHQDICFSKQMSRPLLRKVKTKFKKDGIVLDVGCGPGYFIEELLSNGYKVKGVDITNTQIEHINARFKSNPKFCGAFLMKSFNEIPVETGSIDTIFFMETIEHLFDQQISLLFREFKRILVSGGKLIITTPHCEDLLKGMVYCNSCKLIFHRFQHMQSFTNERIEEIGKSHQFRSEISTAIGLIPDLRSWFTPFRSNNLVLFCPVCGEDTNSEGYSTLGGKLLKLFKTLTGFQRDNLLYIGSSE